jgi:hypothetical protein
MSPEFTSAIAEITGWLAGRPVDAALAEALLETFPPGGPTFNVLAKACRDGVAEGWLAQRGEAPLKWGRVIKPGPETQDFSVDVVRMTDVAGPHHAHPQGEIDMVVPLDPAARFDGQGEGWKVYRPGSAHRPTVTGGTAIILYLLPGGAIEFDPR